MRQRSATTSASAKKEKPLRVPKAPPPPKTVIRFTKIRQWYIPADTETYKVLHKLKLVEVRYHEDFFPTLQLVLRPNGIRAQYVDFKTEILRDFLEKVATRWTANPKRTLRATPTVLRFEARMPAAVHLDENGNKPRSPLEVFPRVEECLRRFFRRWGYSYEFEFSQSPTRAKLVVSFALDREKIPVIPFRKEY